MSDKFEAQRDRVCADIREAHQHYDLYLQLRKSVSVDSRREFINQSPTFWSLTLNAHLTSCRLGLCRVYDKTKGSMSIYQWLRKNRIMLLERAKEPGIQDRHYMNAPVTEDIFTEDLKLTNGGDKLVNTLNTQRNKAIIHSASTEVDELESIFHRYPLTFTDYENLLERAETIFNRYSVLYSGEYHAMYTLGRNDLDRIFPDVETTLKE